MTAPATTTPTAASISVSETLALLNGPFAELANGVAQNRYAFWLGSGISRGRMPGVRDLVLAVLTHLQARSNAAAADCPFRKSLNDILALANVSDAEREQIDFTQSIDDWPNIGSIADRLVLQYARMLDRAPVAEDPDFLVWEALDVVGVYGDPTKDPDVEHFCLAALILEGVASDLPSANWDGLVEKAVDALSGGVPTLRVWVRGEEARDPQLKAELYKFHGCAVSAGKDEGKYRERLIGRASQINGWAARQENAVLVNKLIEIVTTKPTLMLGLSAQDSNIQGVFVAAQERMSWPWPSHPPALVFSENALGPDQEGLLGNVYRAAYAAGTRQAINDSALLKAYAKPLLAALWLSVLGAKLQALIARAPGNLSDADQEQLRAGVARLRDVVAAAETTPEAFVQEAFVRSRRIVSLFREGQEPVATGGRYAALSGSPVQAFAADPSLSTTGLPELSVAVGLLGMLIDDGLEVHAGDASSMPLTVKGVADPAPIFFAANAQAAVRLFVNGHVSPNDNAILVHAHERPPAMPRWSGVERGRKGKPILREVSLTELLQSTPTTPALLQRFREEVTL